jgi:hypothetical protein
MSVGSGIAMLPCAKAALLIASKANHEYPRIMQPLSHE